MWIFQSVEAQNNLLWSSVSCIRCRTLFPANLAACPHCVDLSEKQLLRMRAKSVLFARETGRRLVRFAVAIVLGFVALYALGGVMLLFR